MEDHWRRVARWTGIGNNREERSSTGSKQQMVEETLMQDQENLKQDPEQESPVVETLEAGMDTAADPTATLRAELEQARGERDQLLDRLARLQAEFDNARKREARERADTRDYAIQGAVEPFLGVMDNFALALQSEGDVAQLRAGVQLILKQMDEALRGLNVQPVESVGTQFDPRVHEALGSLETAEYPDHQVLEEIRRGYKIREKLLRPALVKIAVNPAQIPE
ncbi:MAG: nucleotide exchange factor GrpE [Acidobacteriaceae bacterium]